MKKTITCIDYWNENGDIIWGKKDVDLITVKPKGKFFNPLQMYRTSEYCNVWHIIDGDREFTIAFHEVVALYNAMKKRKV